MANPKEYYNGMIFEDDENMLWEVIVEDSKKYIEGVEIPTGKVNISNVLKMSLVSQQQNKSCKG